MKHVHSHEDVDMNINVELPTQDLEDLIDKATDAAITIITVYTIGHVFRSIFAKGESCINIWRL